MRRLIFILMLLCVSCSYLFEEEDPAGGKASLYLNFNASDFSAAERLAQNIDLKFDLDTSMFYLSVHKLLDGGGREPVFEGRYALKPDAFQLEAGTYSIEVASVLFDRPEFSRPVYADRQIVTLEENESFVLSFLCRQINAGIRVKAGSDILKKYPYGFFLLSDSLYSMKYGYDDQRFLFFKEGSVHIRLVKTAVSSADLLKRYMYPGEMLTLIVGEKSNTTPDDFGIRIDTSRFWRNEYVEEELPDQKPEAYTVSQAMRQVGKTNVWVYGYIVGGDAGTKSFSMKPPFKKNTHLLLAGSVSENRREYAMAVELPGGPVRDEFNLVDHPELLGKKVYVRGDIVEKYFGYPGIKSVQECRFY